VKQNVIRSCLIHIVLTNNLTLLAQRKSHLRFNVKHFPRLNASFKISEIPLGKLKTPKDFKLF